jgi:hypothetical protein
MKSDALPSSLRHHTPPRVRNGQSSRASGPSSRQTFAYRGLTDLFAECQQSLGDESYRFSLQVERFVPQSDGDPLILLKTKIFKLKMATGVDFDDLPHVNLDSPAFQNLYERACSELAVELSHKSNQRTKQIVGQYQKIDSKSLLFQDKIFFTIEC